MTYAYAYRPAAFLRVEGEDAAGFLQGQFTNELRQTHGNVVYGLFLNHKGKVVADAHVLGVSEKNFRVASRFSPALVIRQRLEAYIVADDVVLSDETDAMHALALWGDGCGEQLKRLAGARPAPGRFRQEGEMLIYPGRRTAGENYEIIGPENQITALRGRLTAQGGQEVDAGESEYARISEGIPAVPQDIGPGDLPNEGGLDETAISYTKGCYLGQEVMARLRNLGQVRRRLHVVQGATGQVPTTGAALFQGEKKAGEIRSVAVRGGTFVAWAMLTMQDLDRRAGLSQATDAPPTLQIKLRG